MLAHWPAFNHDKDSMVIFVAFIKALNGYTAEQIGGVTKEMESTGFSRWAANQVLTSSPVDSAKLNFADDMTPIAESAVAMRSAFFMASTNSGEVNKVCTSV